MKLAFIGAGRVGAALADRLARAGHDVVLAQTREGSATVTQAIARNPALTASPLAEAVASAEVVLLATPFAAAATLLPPLAEALAGKILVDCTNPVGPGFTHGLGSQQAGAQQIQGLVPGALVVKAFSIYGFENLEDPSFPGYDVRPSMWFCGDEAPAKATVATLITDVGFEPFDVGGLVQALHLEHMTLLWVRLVRAGQRSPHLVWAVLQR